MELGGGAPTTTAAGGGGLPALKNHRRPSLKMVETSKSESPVGDPWCSLEQGDRTPCVSCTETLLA